MKVKIIASEQNWIEGWAIAQLNKTAELPGIKLVVGMPDLHPGKGNPIGAAFVTEKIFYPYLVGSDIGCGMGLWKTTLKKKKIKLDRWVNKLDNLDSKWDGDPSAWLEEYQIQPSEYDKALGTIGGGNHFAELQIVEFIKDKSAFSSVQEYRYCDSRHGGCWIDKSHCHISSRYYL